MNSKNLINAKHNKTMRELKEMITEIGKLNPINPLSQKEKIRIPNIIKEKWVNTCFIDINDDKTHKCIVVIPVYKKVERLKNYERKSLRQVIDVLGDKYNISLVCPFGFDVQSYRELMNYDFSVLECNKEYFKSQKAYSNLCLRYEFYESFSTYDYMLIYQLDAWVFEDKLDYFIDMGYDYYGAPHLFKNDKGQVGNGGLSLRKIDKFTNVCYKTKFENYPSYVLEDVLFTRELKKRFNICPYEIAYQFSWQDRPIEMFETNGKQLPMGCHAFHTHSWKEFWSKYIDIKDIEVPKSIERINTLQNKLETLKNKML